ncbi:MAG: undecaprenyl-diphosphate phosphatase [Lachnospiraceae bacterium]|nr:undecaprenyl-diphosphate phosphatase [Lachnospiraceae bacterium]
MSVLQAIFLGVIQGLTEFLPVSSSGHLVIFQKLFHIETDFGVLFDVLLHVGTLVSVFLIFRKDIMLLIKEFIGMITDLFYKIRDPYVVVINSAYRKFVLLIIVSTIPTGILGFVARDFVSYASGSLLITGICLIITSAALFYADMQPEGRKSVKSSTYLNAFEIGIAQGIATMPGLSRSGLTITTCLACGFKREFAFKYSFIMSIPAIIGAVILELKDITKSDITGGAVLNCLAGMVAAGVVGFVALKLMIAIVKNKKYIFFSIYCFVAGLVAVIANFFI